MAIDLMMPALSPTMEKGTLARWLVAVGDVVKPGDLIAEIETDKATIEYESANEGTIAEIVVPEGTDDVPVGALIARLSDDQQSAASAGKQLSPSARRAAKETGVDPATVNGTGRDGRVTREDLVATRTKPAVSAAPAPAPAGGEVAQQQPGPAARLGEEARPAPPVSQPIDPTLSPLIGRILAARGLDAKALVGSGPGGRVLLSDLTPSSRSASPASPPFPEPAPTATSAFAVASRESPVSGIPHDTVKLSNMRKTIARRLTESKQQVPHIYLTVDVRLDALLKLRAELNEALVDRGVKLSVNDLIIKAQALALLATPACNVQYTPDSLIRFSRADISVAVSIPDGLITPIIVDASAASLSTIATSMKDLASRARAGQLHPSEYQGGTASLSNLGMFGINQFGAVINPPQAMILAVGAGERRMVVDEDEPRIATVMTATGSFDHRAIDGADAAAFMSTFRSLVESPLNLIG